MNANQITELLYKKFESHKYQLTNTFVYNEESDFFSITNSGYAQEVEVKISKSDFKADFKKYKHNSFDQIYNGQKYILRKGSIVYKIKEPIMKDFIGKDGKRVLEEDKYGRKRPKKVPSGKFREYDSHGEYSNKRVLEKGGKVEAIYTNIRIFKPKLPNKFWFAVPENLVSLEDIPEYAGLMYILPNGKIKVIKKAPFIHKEKHDLKQVLLDKFYYLSQRLKNENKFYKKSLEG